MSELHLDFRPAAARLNFGSAQRVPTGTTDYEELQNLPQINGEELIGNKSAEELGLATPEDIPTDNAELRNGAGYVTAPEAAAAAPVQSVNGKTGEVELDAEDVGALPSTTTLDNLPDGTTYKRATGAQLQQISTNAAAIALKQAIINASGILKGGGNGQVTAAAAGTDYLAPSALTAYRTAAAQDTIDADKIDKTGDGSNVTVTFTQSATRAAITTGEKLSVMFGKIAKWLNDLGTAAFRTATATIESGSTALIESGAVYTAVSGKYSKPAGGIPASDLAPGVIPSVPVQSVNGKTGAVELSASDVGAGTYSKPSGGIPKTDLAQAVQTSLGKADTALQSVPSTYRTAAAQDEIDEEQDTAIEGKAPATSGVYYGKCTTAAATQAKTVTVNGTIALETGTMILVWFQYAQTYNGVPTLNVNGLGAKNVGRVSGANAARYEWSANEVLLLLYDGTRWVISDGALATTTYYGVTKLYTGAVGTSASAALTPVSLSNLTRDMICSAPIYATSSTYAVGDLCRNYYNLYRCIVPIDTAEAWTAEHWEALPPLLEMLEQGGVQVVTVSGTTPTITALPGVRYVFGEVATLDLTPPASGICDVIFTSGSTATVLTVPSTVRWANGFDPTSLEADTTYEINILDGLGVAASWT